MIKPILPLLAAMTFLSGPALAAGTSIADATDDFLETYVGPQAADLDIVRVAALRNGQGVLLTSTLNAAVGSLTPGGISLWGIDRGGGFPGLVVNGPPSIGPDTILMNAVVALNYNGTGRVVLFNGGAPVTTNLAPGVVQIDGNRISAFIPFSLLPEASLQRQDFTYVNWTRSGLGSQAFIADFAPETAGFTAAVPEPASWAMLIAGFGVVGAAARRRRPVALA